MRAWKPCLRISAVAWLSSKTLCPVSGTVASHRKWDERQPQKAMQRTRTVCSEEHHAWDTCGRSLCFNQLLVTSAAELITGQTQLCGQEEQVLVPCLANSLGQVKKNQQWHHATHLSNVTWFSTKFRLAALNLCGDLHKWVRKAASIINFCSEKHLVLYWGYFLTKLGQGKFMADFSPLTFKVWESCRQLETAGMIESISLL